MPHSQSPAKRWFEYAARDLRVAKLCLEQSDEAFLNSAAFHLQQVCEKVLKGVLVFHDHRFNKTHNLIELSNGVKNYYPEENETMRNIILLNKYVIISRYPMDEEISRKDIEAILPFVDILYQRFMDKIFRNS
jgi:HEPN domain-containing protein